MGNTNTGVSSGVKDQASGGTKGLYKYINLIGGGELVGLMKIATKSKDFTAVDEMIVNDLKPFMYNEDGSSIIVHASRCVAARKGMNQNDLPERPQDAAIIEANKGNPDWWKDPSSGYKELCWKLDEMGFVGETALHVCLLNATSIHADLAKRLLSAYPKLINDIYISDEYFGENMLHMAIVNEDPAMVKYLLDMGCDFNQRATGNFFTADDQKAKRKDSLDHEWYLLPEQSNYEGYTYWGEFPLGFAACLGQEECVRLLRAKGADPNQQDTNANTVLHMLVVHDYKAYCHPEEMFDLIVDLGGKLHIKNRQGLTPLTLAAKLGHKEIYDHILGIEREVYWIFGNVTCAAYPLEHIDTISPTGEINTKSALYNIIYGQDPSHLEMIDGIIEQLLEEKWKTFAKFRFFKQFIYFVVYFLITMVAVFLRPGTDLHFIETKANVTFNTTTVEQTTIIKNPCFLLQVHSTTDIVRFIAEVLTLAGSVFYIFMSMREIYHQGNQIFFQTLRLSPGKAMFLLSNFFVVMIVPGRAACSYVYEDCITILAILTTAPYFLFFCRGYKLVGPFVIMIYKMITTDLIRFFVIYLIFVVGFSQALFVMFLGVDTPVFYDAKESLIGLFIMSLGDFGDIYDSFARTPHPSFCKLIFVVYMVLVTLLLINMLIAMMANTYDAINSAEKEWLRQWASVILVTEQLVTTKERNRQQVNYSQPMLDGRRALVIRWHQTGEDGDEEEDDD